MLIELFLRLFSVSVTRTSRGCWFDKLKNEGPFNFEDEALRLKAKDKWSMLYHDKANQNFAKNRFKTKKIPPTWYIICDQ